MAVIPLSEPVRRPATPPRGFALLALGFRPFYLLAASLALLLVPLWVLMLGGQIPQPTTLPGLLWHGHEMIFGFAAAVIVGFLLTAGQTWSGLSTPSGRPLAALVALWLAGRLGLLMAPPLLGALLDLAFLPVAGVMLGRVLIRARSRRNYFALVILAALALSNLLMHGAQQGWFALSPLLGLHLAVAIIAVLCTVIAGRIVPSFTANALGTKPWRNARVDQASIVLTAAALLAWACALPAALTGALAAPAAVLQALRCQGWRPWATRRTPLLWILHLSHGWLIVALAWLALASFDLTPAPSLLHLITVGTISGLIIAMITRTALGHTGRALKAGALETACYALMQLALLARVLPPLIDSRWYLPGLQLSAIAWALCFALYLWRYAPILWHPRVDGRAG
ncbi:MAG: short-chain dehydrogenase [Candidatus Dactylopiibacterium carminicum]|uniref:NnrS family protein n=1 Tax=Candidatus Dactylopiibacterium carminicum TaxID=857335 RepID=A0A272EW46_9RHOO|nr:NnrS family protein [Candidatus Dactylopiibacterium carminicum]KAF7599520.1 NnrS family protein [Candidatus Dactylopiibacterium carminicum]PAS94286.1 MAG: short-chain dehydrogenase [Candidatus Dactylopiibacterium carminicum]PAS98482.1 MAG: short-chain dehydrogenase [Candidatus Dactylopiibacterium carminicum]PAS99526.1 MAG: short-chain dehydrogenase [Candidatus Dactylopiibacterium carminicum]